MTWLNNKIPPPLIFLLFALAMWQAANHLPIVVMANSVRIALTMTVGSLGFFLGVAGVVEFKRAKTTVNPLKPESTSSLVCSGIYKLTRNPMYLGLAIMLVSLAIYLSSPMSLVGVLGFVGYINQFQIKPEEQAIETIFGEEFATYKARVRRWI